MKYASIHQKPEEKLANNSDAMLEAIKNIPQSDSSSVVRKLDEVKSATLATNITLKKMAQKEVPTVQKVSLEGVSVVTIKGDKGEQGLQGVRGPKGDKGIDGKNGTQGESLKGDRGEAGPQGVQGVSGANGIQGIEGKQGIAGFSGKDGSPDLPDEIVRKINEAVSKIDPKQIKGLLAIMRSVEEYGKNPQGQYEHTSGGGASQLILRDSTGAKVSEFVTELKFGSNLIPTYSGNGVVTVTATGGSVGTKVRDENASTLTLAQAPLANTLQLFRGGARQSVVNGDYTIVGAVITLTNPLQTNETLSADYEY